MMAIELPAQKVTLTKDLYWPSEAATILGVSKMTIYRWIENGKLEPLMKNPPYRIPRSEISGLLQESPITGTSKIL